MKQLLASVYGKLTVLKKLKNFTDFKLRKQLVQSLLLSKIDFNDVVFSSLTTTNMKKLNRLLLAVASFVYSRYATQNDIIKLNWLPIQERRDYNYLKAIHKAIYDETWPDINKIDIYTNSRNLRGKNDLRLKPSNITGCFQNSASLLLNNLPVVIRNDQNYKSFCSTTRQYLMDQAIARNLIF